MESHILQTPHTGTISKYHCPPQGYARVPNGSIGGRLSYPTEPNPLRYKQKEQRQHGTCCYEYNNNKGFISYTQSWPQYHDGSFTYYLYDHLARPIETGEARITQIKTGDVTEAKQLTNAAVIEHILGLDNRTNVMVAVYDDENAFPIAKDADCWYTHLDDKIATVYYYPQINACDTRTDSGAYHTSQPWYASLYHYDADRKITASHYQCSQGPAVEIASPQPTVTNAAPATIQQQVHHVLPVQPLFSAALSRDILNHTQSAEPWCIPVFAAPAAHRRHQYFAAPDPQPAHQAININPYHRQHTLVYNAHTIPAATVPFSALSCRGHTINNCSPPPYSHSPPGRFLV